MYLKWVAAFLYCTLIAVLGNMHTCSHNEPLHAGAFNHAEAISE